MFYQPTYEAHEINIFTFKALVLYSLHCNNKSYLAFIKCQKYNCTKNMTVFVVNTSLTLCLSYD